MIGMQLFFLVISILGIVLMAVLYAIRWVAGQGEIPPERIPARQGLEIFYRIVIYGLCLTLPATFLPIFVTFVFSAIFIGVMFQWRSLSHREAVQTLNESIRLACQNEGSITKVANGFGSRNATFLGAQAKAFAIGLERGADIVSLIHWLQIPLETETLLAIQHKKDSTWSTASKREVLLGGMRLDADDQYSATPLWSYFFTVMLFINLLILFLVTFIVPTMKEMMNEFDLGSPALDNHWFTLGINNVPMISIILMLGWAMLRLTYWLTNWKWLRWLLPFSVPIKRAQNQSEWLNGLAAAVDAGQESSQALHSLIAAYRDPGAVQSLRLAATKTEQGMPLSIALSSSGLIPKRSATWIDAATKTDHLASSLRQIGRDLQRRAQMRFNSATAILFPLSVIVCGIVVLAVGHYLFLFLTTLITGLAPA